MGFERRIWRILAACGVLLVAGEATASAQFLQPWNDRVFVHVDGGAQTKARSYTVSGDFPLYGETATWESVLATGNGGLIDVGGGARVLGNLGVSVSFSQYADSYSAPVDGSVPDPLFFDRPRSSSTRLDGLDHTENAVHVSGSLTIPVTEQLEIMVFGGPTFFSLSKGVVENVAVVSGGTRLEGATGREVSASGNGVHVGADISYIALRMDNGLGLGVGLFLRHSAGSVDVAEVDGGSVDVGGFNYGGGLRVRF